ncbi:MAG: hydantoinase/oxoprolinase family protein, partial [Chloroflexi bacterium]|nr:hydantoinase/oxoprolinase family protein [Chloroflexota bacterium]
MPIALGIDTGGTYTDAVLLDYQSGEVLGAAKALTTRHDLSIGIEEAMARVIREAGEIGLVSLSTTLATNALVEGKGAPVCALLIGYDERTHADWVRTLNTDRVVFLSGGHTTTGEEITALDERAVRSAIAQHAPHVAAFAISGYFAPRNPAHELAVKRLVHTMTGLPCTCGHELTHRLNALRRATTVALNASLIPLVCDLIAAVERSMARLGIRAPLMVVKGDGSLMSADVAKERPIETILSGPAASVVGAQHLASSPHAIVVDMGGTTTDIALVRHGR